MNHRVIIGVLLASILLGNATYASAATLWDLVIKAELEQAQIGLNDKPVVFGTILDQVAKPVPNAEIKIRFSNNAVTTTTDSKGIFRYEFGEQFVEGTFSVVVSAKSADKKGFATLTLKVGKESTTFNELYYKTNEINANKTTANDPYAELKQKRYQKFIEEQNKKKQKMTTIESKKLALQEKRSIARQMLDDKVEERKVGAGVISEKQQDRYLSKINPKIKGAISSQLNYTKQIFAEAQYAMKEVLDNGGSLQDARKAYFEKLSVTKEQLSDINDLNNTANHPKIKTKDTNKINSKKVKGLTLNKNLK